MKDIILNMDAGVMCVQDISVPVHVIKKKLVNVELMTNDKDTINKNVM